MINSTVQLVQKRLNSLGFNLNVDGVLGAKTRAALTAFQEAKGLPSTGTATGDTLLALIKSGPQANVPTPSPNMRPPADQLGTGNANTAPRLRPPPEQLGQGFTNRLPNLRPNQTPGLPTPNGGPPMAAAGGYGAFTPTPPPNPGVSAGVGLNFDAMRRLDATAGARGIEAKQRFMAPIAQGGMGQPRFPQMSQFPMTGNGIPVAPAGGNLGNGLPFNTQQMASGANPPTSPPMQPLVVPPVISTQPPPTGGLMPSPAQPQQASAGGMLGNLAGAVGGAFGGAPQGWQPTADQPGYGMPGQAPNPSFLGAVGDAGRAAAGGIQSMIGAAPANAGKALDWVLSNNLKGVNGALGMFGMPNLPGTPAQPPTNFTPPPQPPNPALQQALQQAVARQQAAAMAGGRPPTTQDEIWRAIIQGLISTQAASGPPQFLQQDDQAPAAPPPPPYGSPMGAYR